MPTFNPTPFDPAKPETQPAIPTTADQRGQHANGNTAFTAAHADVAALETTVSGHVADSTIHFTEGSITHNNVGGRTTVDAHPTSAITGLDAALLSKLENVIEDTTPQLGGDIETKGNEIVLTRADDTVHGALLAEETLGGAALYYTDTAGAYDFLDGAVQVGPGHATLHGTVARVSSLSHTESTRQQVYADQAGGLYAVEEPPAGWTVEDTDAADYDLGAPGTGTGTWIQLTGLVINTGGALTTGQRVDIAVTLSVVNKASNRSGLIEIYYGVDGGVPGALDVDDTSPVSQGFAGQLTLGGLEIADADYSSGIPITIWARAAGGSGVGYGLDLVGSVIAPHRLIVSVASGGTGGGSGIAKGTPFTVGDILLSTNDAGAGEAATPTNVAAITGTTTMTLDIDVTGGNAAQYGAVKFRGGFQGANASDWQVDNRNGLFIIEALNDNGSTRNHGLIIGNDVGNPAASGAYLIGATGDAQEAGSLNTTATYKNGVEYMPGVFTANGDILTQQAGVPAKVAIGTELQVMFTLSGLPAWSAQLWPQLVPGQTASTLVAFKDATGEHEGTAIPAAAVLRSDASGTIGSAVGVAGTDEPVASGGTYTPDPLIGQYVLLTGTTATTIGLLARTGTVVIGIPNGVAITLNVGYKEVGTEGTGDRQLIVSRVGTIYIASWLNS